MPHLGQPCTHTKCLHTQPTTQGCANPAYAYHKAHRHQFPLAAAPLHPPRPSAAPHAHSPGQHPLPWERRYKQARQACIDKETVPQGGGAGGYISEPRQCWRAKGGTGSRAARSGGCRAHCECARHRGHARRTRKSSFPAQAQSTGSERPCVSDCLVPCARPDQVNTQSTQRHVYSGPAQFA